ncbi:MAG: transposase [Deltaproteobacteria bacterium]|nr:transposase [Deltaproteobacteria bacterium]
MCERRRDYWRTVPRDLEWLLIEWPTGEKEPIKYWLSTVSEKVSLDDLVRLVKLRWRIERDYQEMKDELGLDHYEGRCWRGFHHHGVLCIAAYAFLAAERARLSPPTPLAFPRAAPTGGTTRRQKAGVRARRLQVGAAPCPAHLGRNRSWLCSPLDRIRLDAAEPRRAL